MVALSKSGAIGNVINVKSPTYGAVGDGVFVTATLTIGSGSGALLATGASFTAADIGKTISVPGAGAAGGLLATTIATFTDATHVGLTATAGTALSAVSGQICYGTNDTTALQAAVNAAVAAGKPLYVPTGRFLYTAPLTVSANLSIIGDWAAGDYINGGNIDNPGLLVGSVLCPSANGNHGISSTTSLVTLNFTNIAMQFQIAFGRSGTTTGDGVNITPATTGQGASLINWNNFIVFGHDGDHYALNAKNPIYGTISAMSYFGGGGLNFAASAGNFGNLNIYGLFGITMCGGAAYGAKITSASGSKNLNLITFYHPQLQVTNIGGVTPAANPPTSAQYIWWEDDFVQTICKVSPDFETNVNSGVRYGLPGVGNDWNAAAASYNMGTGNINLTAWANSGPLMTIPTFSFNDLTSSGTVASMAMMTFASQFVKATSATTFTKAALLNIGIPSASTNVTITTPQSILASGQIEAPSFSSSLGYFGNGTLSLYNATAPPAGGTAGTGLKVSNVSNFGVFFGTGAPTLAGALGSLYLSRNGAPYYNRDGATAYSQLLGADAVNTVSPTSPNRTLTVVIGGTTYYIAAKTTND